MSDRPITASAAPTEPAVLTIGDIDLAEPMLDEMLAAHGLNYQ